MDAVGHLSVNENHDVCIRQLNDLMSDAEFL